MRAAVKVHEEMQTKLVKYEINEMLENVETVNGVKVLKRSFVDKNVDELKEIILQMSVYAGFPSAINGMNALKEVLDEGK